MTDSAKIGRRGLRLAEPGRMHSPQLHTLPDGRAQSYVDLGDQDGSPVLYCHGFPSSRYEALPFASALEAMRIRLLVADRPGYGASTFHPGRSIAGWADDVMSLLDTLGIQQVRLLGVSGGAPYALGCAARYPERVEAVSIVGGLGALAEPESTAEMLRMSAAMLDFARSAPMAAFQLYSHVVGRLMHWFPGLAYRILTNMVPPADRQVLAVPRIRAAYLQSIVGAFVQGGRGPAWDMHLYTSPWSFSLDEVRVPVQVWHGDADATVPLSMARRHVDALSCSEARFVPGEGHFSIVINHVDEILATLTGATGEP